MEPTSRSANWPRLSLTLQPFKSRKICQKCGRCPSCSGDFKTRVYLWIEHDHNDLPEPIYVSLCTKCSNEIIEPHVRLYRMAGPFEPLPGVMDICGDCRWRNLSRCACPAAVFNGGAEPGIQIDIEAPAVAFVDGTRNGRRWGHRQAIYYSPAKGCSGKEVK